jgi:hypothetical protein
MLGRPIPVRFSDVRPRRLFSELKRGGQQWSSAKKNLPKTIYKTYRRQDETVQLHNGFFLQLLLHKQVLAIYNIRAAFLQWIM